MRVLSKCPLWSLSVEDLNIMAKALFGHVGGPDPRMVSEMRRLQQRVRDLEAELTRLQEMNDVLADEVAHEDLLVRDREPALA
jgi:hemerythrin-like domain-containing protein